MGYGPSIKLARLYECTSKSGKTYFRGRLGAANIAVLKSDETSESGQAIWNVVISEPERQSEYQPRAGKPDHQAPPDGESASAGRNFDRKLEDEIPF